MPRAYTIVVAQTFIPKWKGMTHHDVLVWTCYFLYSLPGIVTSDFTKQQKFKQVFHTLRRYELIDIHVSN